MTVHTTVTLASKSIAHNWKPANPTNPPRAILILQHGFGEYAERYTTSHAGLIPALTERNIDVWALDLEGHGQSPGDRGRGVVDVNRAVMEHVWLCEHVAGAYGATRFTSSIEGGAMTTSAAMTTILEGGGEGEGKGATADNKPKPKPNAKHPPIFLFGHSLGGLVTAGSATALLTKQQQRTLQNPRANKIAGVILTSPAFPIPGLTLPARLKALLINLLTRPIAYIFPRTQVPWPASPGGTLCGDAKQVRIAAEDEGMYHGQISWTVASTAVSVVRRVWEGIRQGVWNNGVDVFVVHGRGDCWTDWRGSSWFVEGVRKSRGGACGPGKRVPDIGEEGEWGGTRLEVLDSPYHELLNAEASEGQDVLRMLLEWIEKRIKS
ncbi:Alpha/Beta hydrolase protein [Aspergillus pseudoustus]|uniref:Alpha/Beta hydrolase protein n=1 Tax=Aspergillus pseudoustus TaxID=1810923 RepID=A0ABR4JZ23_9EURO